MYKAIEARQCPYLPPFVLQLYVGGNAALIGQKLATNPDLKVCVPEVSCYSLFFNEAQTTSL